LPVNLSFISPPPDRTDGLAVVTIIRI